MRKAFYRNTILLGLLLAGMTRGLSAGADARGWLDWRGPQQTGVSTETGLPDTWALGGANDLWSYDLGGGGTPIIADGRVYIFGYRGQGTELREVLACVNAETGKRLWEHAFSDFLGDITYDRYAIGSPAVDAQTGNVYVVTAAGIFACFSRDGKLLWEHSLMEELGRLTFTNGRNGSPFIADEYVITRYIMSNWGGEGAAADRFYAYDKRTGQLVWSSTPGVAPKDNVFSRPYFAWRNGKRVFYTGTGCGHVTCVNARTGEPIWRYPASVGGLNPSVVLYKDTVIAIHNDENLDSSTVGRMFAIKVSMDGKPAEAGAPLLDKSAEVWHNEIRTVSSSPVLVGNRLYVVNHTGELCSVDADTGKILWEHKLGPDQLHASALYADGKLYVPLQNGSFFIIKPSDSGAQELSKVQLAGRCIGAPSVWNGKVYVLSTEKLYCFGKKGNGSNLPAPVVEERPKPGKTVALQIIPAEVRLRPGEKAKFTVRGIDANGFVTETFDSKRATWAKYIPPTARVRSEMNAEFNAQGELVASSSPLPSAGAFQATIGEVKGTFRGRILPTLPLTEDFEKFSIDVPHQTETGVKFAYPPLPWIGARFKWEVRELDGNKVFAKTLDNIFFQRSTVFFGYPEAKNYTFETDVRSDGNRRTMSSVGVVNQRYLIALNGNAQELEVSSNQDRLKVGIPFKWKAGVWYRLKTRVDVASDGSGVVRAKVWLRGESEPEKWTLEAPHRIAHRNGSPGLFGFAPQSLFRVYFDNISVTANDQVARK